MTKTVLLLTCIALATACRDDGDFALCETDEDCEGSLQCYFARENASGVCTHACSRTDPRLCDDLVVPGGDSASKVGFCGLYTSEGFPSVEEGEPICVLTCSPVGGHWTEIECGGAGYECIGPTPGRGGICVGAVER